MHIDIVTIFPGLFEGFLQESMIRIGQSKGLVEFNVHDLRDWTYNKHRQVDDVPYGGGSGMVMKPDPFYDAVLSISKCNNLDCARQDSRIIVFTPRGKRLDQNLVEELAAESRLILLCGRYEGIDERVHEHIATDEISLGDFILSGGEIPAMALSEAIVRLIPGVLGAKESLLEESFQEALLEYPQYTRPPEFMGWKVPEILFSGHHGEIAKWRREKQLGSTFVKRPDLLEKSKLSDTDKKILDKLRDSLSQKQHNE